MVGIAATLVDGERVVCIPVVIVLVLLVVPAGIVVDGAFLDVGERAAAFGEEVVVEPLLELAARPFLGTSSPTSPAPVRAGPAGASSAPEPASAGPGRDLDPP